MNQDPNVLQAHPLSPALGVSLPLTSVQSEVTPPTSPAQGTFSPRRNSSGGGLFAKIRALSSSSGSSSSTTTAPATSPQALKQKPKLLLSRIRENRLTRKEVISDSNEMCIRKLVN